jgi:hypothetical protein
LKDYEELLLSLQYKFKMKNMNTKLVFNGDVSVTVTGRSKKELFANIYSEIKQRAVECSIEDKSLSREYNKWCAVHTSTQTVPEKISHWHQARCGFAVPYAETYKKQNLK